MIYWEVVDGALDAPSGVRGFRSNFLCPDPFMPFMSFMVK